MRVDSGRLWYLPELPEVELLTGHYQQQVFPWHAHETYCISLQEQGTETIAFAGQVLRVASGQLLVIAPGEVHTNYAHYPHQAWQYRSLYIASSLLEALAPVSWGPFEFPTKLLEDAALFGQLQQAHQQLTLTGYSPATYMRLEQALTRLVRDHARPTLLAKTLVESPLPRLSEVLALVSHHLADKLTVHDLAVAAGLGRFPFTRAFTQATGLSPMAYVLQQRLLRAKHFLQQGMLPVEAALETGFFDQSHFARYFKRLVGTTPGQYQAPARTIVQSCQ